MSDTDNGTPQPFAQYVRHLGRGPGRSRHLTQAEAEDAMGRILDGTVAPEAVGALLMLMRYRTETAEEMAGFIAAVRRRLAAWQAVPAALDWPSYASGKSRGAPWFVLAARLVAGAGVPVLMHGYNSHHLTNPVSPGHVIAALGIPEVGDPGAAARALETSGIAYVPLARLSRRLLQLVDLRDVFSLRSPVNTCLRGMNPALAPASVQGVFHPPYRELQRDAAALLGQPALTVIKGGGGEAERHPGKPVEVYGLRDGAVFDETLPAFADMPARRLAGEGGPPALGDVVALWEGQRADPFAEAVILGTAALALYTAGRAADMETAAGMARDLWRARRG